MLTRNLLVLSTLLPFALDEISCGQHFAVLKIYGGGINYRKWEELADALSDDESTQHKCHVTKLKRPSKVHLKGSKIMIEGDNMETLHMSSGPRQEEANISSAVPTIKHLEGLSKILTGASDQLLNHSDYRVPEFVAEDDLDLPRSQPKPLVEEWRPVPQRWKAVDYSRWNDLGLSDQSQDHGNLDTDPELDLHDAELVRDKFRKDLKEAVGSRQEESLRKILKTAESLYEAGLIDEKEVDCGKQALLNISDRSHCNASTTSSSTRSSLHDALQDQELLESLTRNGGCTESFIWSQTRDHVVLHIFVADDVRGADVSLSLGKDLLRVNLHDPEPSRAIKFFTTAAETRRLRQVLFEARLANPVRFEDNETEWEMCEVPQPGSLGPRRRAVRVLLTKKPPGEHFFQSSLPEWDDDYDGAGEWRGSLLRVWWDRVRPDDDPIDVGNLPDRVGRAGAIKELWRKAKEELRSGVRRMGPVDISTLMQDELVSARLETARAALRAEGVPDTSLDWAERMGAVEAAAREEAQAMVRERREERRLRLEEEARLNEQWLRSQADRRARRRVAPSECGGGNESGSDSEEGSLPAGR